MATMATSRPHVETPSPSVSPATGRARLVKAKEWVLPLCLEGILNVFDLSNKNFQKNTKSDIKILKVFRV